VATFPQKSETSGYFRAVTTLSRSYGIVGKKYQRFENYLIVAQGNTNIQ